MNSRPYEPVNGVLSGSIECAAAPARSPFASSLWNRAARRVTGNSPGSPRRAIASGCLGGAVEPEESGEHLVDVSHQRPEEAAVRCPVVAQARRSLVYGRHNRTRTPSVERVGEGHLGREQLDASCRQADTSKERRGRHQRVDRRANVMVKAWERQFGRAAPSARGRFSFVDLDRKTGASQSQRGGQPVRARADDDSVERGHHWHGSGPSGAGHWCWPARGGVPAPPERNVPA